MSTRLKVQEDKRPHRGFPDLRYRLIRHLGVFVKNRQRLLQMALRGLEVDRDNIDAEIREVNREIAQLSRGTSTDRSLLAPTKRVMSAEARRKISEGMKRRYAELRKAVRTSKK